MRGAAAEGLTGEQWGHLPGVQRKTMSGYVLQRHAPPHKKKNHISQLLRRVQTNKWLCRPEVHYKLC